MLAFPWGARCRWICICDREALSASSKALLATAFGASRTRCRSEVAGVMRLNCLRSTLLFYGSISLAITVCHPTVYSVHPRLPCVCGALLRYTHIYLSSSDFCTSISILSAGACVAIYCGAVFCTIGAVLCVSGIFVFGLLCSFCVCTRFEIFYLVCVIVVLGVFTFMGDLFGVSVCVCYIFYVLSIYYRSIVYYIWLIFGIGVFFACGGLWAMFFCVIFFSRSRAVANSTYRASIVS